jgi:hypothetical protein
MKFRDKINGGWSGGRVEWRHGGRRPKATSRCRNKKTGQSPSFIVQRGGMELKD